MAVLEMGRPAAAVVPKIRRVSESPRYIKALIIGDSGEGKTYLAGTMPNILLCLSEKSVSEATLWALHRAGIDPDIWDIDSLDDLRDAYLYLASGDHNYTAVGLDSLTDLSFRIYKEVVAEAFARSSRHDSEVAEMSDWNRITMKIRGVVDNFRDLPLDVVMTARVMDIRNEMKKVPFVQPRQIATDLPAHFNLVGYLERTKTSDGDVRRLHLEPQPTTLAKNPGGMLPAHVDNPD
jgi:hypothetical protein